MRAGHAKTFTDMAFAYAIALGHFAFARVPAALALDPVETFRQAVAVHHQIVLRERRCAKKISAAHRERIEAERVRHLVEQALEGEADIDGAVAAEGAAWRRVGQHALAQIFDVVEIVDRVQHRAGIKDGDNAIARMGAAALDAFAFDAGDLAVLAHADLELDIGLRPAAMGDEGLLAVDHDADAAAGLAGEERCDQFDIERLGAAAETAADMGLDHADARHVHGEDLRQHQVHVVRHLRRGVHGHAVAHHVVIGDRGVHLHLVLAHLGAIVGAFADQIGRRKSRGDIAELEQHIALEILRFSLVNGDGAGRHRFGSRVIGREFAHLQLDAAQRLLRGSVIDRGDGGDRLAAIAHPVARQRVLAPRDRQHAKSLVAIGAGDDGLHARQLCRLRYIHFENLGVRIGAAKNSPGQHSRRDEIGGVFGAAGDFLRAVDHRHIVADVMSRHDLVHGETPAACSAAACCTASMILT